MLIKNQGNAISLKGKKDAGILLIHGITSTTQSMAYLADKFQEQGYHVEVPLLKHHNTRWEDMKQAHRQEWINDCQAALVHLQNKVSQVSVMGLSMGGALALRLAQTHHNILALIVINHALFLGNPAVPLAPVLKYIMPSVPAIAGDMKDPDAVEAGYERLSISAVYQLYRLCKRVKRHLRDIKLPTLIFKSTIDHVVPRKSATYTFDHISSKNKELIWLTNSYHVATLDNDKDLIFEKSLSFIQSLEK